MILVTGGDGFIGRHVCSLLSRSGHQLVATDRAFITPAPYPTIPGDLTNHSFLAELFREYPFDTVIHLASLLNTASRQRPQAAMQVNIGASLGLLELALQFRIRKFIYGSSISAYGSKRFPDYKDVPETTPASPDDVYGICKRYVEVVGETYRHQTGLQFVALRIATVIGAGARNTSSPWRSEIFEELTTAQPRTINIPYLPDELVPLVHVEDVAEMIRRLAEADEPAQTIYNTPAESWTGGELALHLSSLNQQLCFTFGQSIVEGIPQVINGRRFVETFGFRATPLKERLAAALNKH